MLAFAAGDARYAKQAETALRRSISLQPVFSPQRFLEEKPKNGVPDEITAAYIQTASTTDETFLSDVDK